MLSLFVAVCISITGCTGKSEIQTIQPDESLNSNKSNQKNTNKEKGIALAISGCSQGSLVIESSQSFTASFFSWRGVAFKAINEYKNEINPDYSIEIWRSDFTEQSFIVAKMLDSKWNDLYELWEESVLSVRADLNRGKNVGQASGNAFNFYSPRLDSICNLAINEGTLLAEKENLSILDWARYVGGDLIPPGYESLL